MIHKGCSRRRSLAGLGSLVLGTSCRAGTPPRGDSRRGTAGTTRVIAFDAFPIFDPRPIRNRLAGHLGAASVPFLAKWRTRQFEYTWWLAAAGNYLDFWEVTLRSLRFANESNGGQLSEQEMTEIAKTYFHLPAWPDAKDALRQLAQNGYQLALLSNFTPAMLRGCLRSSGLEDLPISLLSADAVRSFKPSPQVYSLAMDSFGVGKDQVTFVAFAPWDALGASWFGYRTFWVNRGALAEEELEPKVPQHDSLAGFTEFLLTQ